MKTHGRPIDGRCRKWELSLDHHPKLTGAMTIISHKHKFIFLKSRKTAGSSVEGWLAPQLGAWDIIATSRENRHSSLPVFGTPHLVTNFPRLEGRAKKALRRFRPALRLEEHSLAVDVRRQAGEKVWRNYFKFSIERQPWERLISLWVWRRHRLQRPVSFDHFLDGIESGDGDPFFECWSNMPIYTDGQGAVVADKIIDYRNLLGGLGEVAHTIGLALSTDGLPRHKSGHRSASDTVASLSQQQIRRISKLCRDEIELFGWDEPRGSL
jgi:hypothetical protein